MSFEEIELVYDTLPFSAPQLLVQWKCDYPGCPHDHDQSQLSSSFGHVYPVSLQPLYWQEVMYCTGQYTKEVSL